jgi:hypothetical protein
LQIKQGDSEVGGFCGCHGELLQRLKNELLLVQGM